MTNIKILIFFLIFAFISHCSFDSKTGIWKGDKEERTKMSEIEREQRQIIDIVKVHTSENIYSKEILLNTKSIRLSEPKKNTSWKMSSLNQRNFLGNLYLPSIDNVFLKKKIGKNKFDLSRIQNTLLIFDNNIIFSDDTGTIFNINQNGKINWKINIYKKLYKKIFKNLVFSIYKNNIYVSDNIGFIYGINLDNGKIIWLKNYAVPLKSYMKVFDNKIFLIDQDNKILSLKTEDGGNVWNILSISSFIKSQSLLSLAISKDGNLIAINSSSDLFNIDSGSGKINWAANTSKSLLSDSTDFFKSSEIVLTDNEIIFSAGSSIFSYNLIDGSVNWENEIPSSGTPIVVNKNIFYVTENGYFIIMNINSGKVISSTNILKILKKKKQKTQITGFIMGSGKIYSVTLNGFLIVSSALSGKVESFKKIGDRITSSPVINNGKLFVLTENSKIIGFN